MNRMFGGYNAIPSGVVPGTITEHEALRENGLKVLLSPVYARGGFRNFSVESARSEFSTQKATYLMLLAACLFGIAGGLFMKFYALEKTGSYLNYPAANCTVLNIALNVVTVEYKDSQNTSIVGIIDSNTIDITTKDWIVGSVFVCLYKGSFVLDKKDIEDNYSSVKSIWFLGFIIPIPTVLFSGGILLLAFWMRSRWRIPYFYSRNNNNNSDQSLTIADWGPVRSDLREHFHALFRAHYALDAPASRQMSFSRPVRDNSAVFKGAMIFLAIICIGLFGGSVFWAGFLSYGFTSGSSYLIGILVLFSTTPMLFMGLYCLKMAASPRLCVDTNIEMIVQCSVMKSNNNISISGTIRPVVAPVYRGRIQ